MVGFLAGNALGLYIGAILYLDEKIILLMSLLGAAVFFALALLAKLITGGDTIVYYHHEIAILGVCSICLRLLHLPVLPYLDIVIIGIAVFLAFGRIGCFSVGCCHGKPVKHGVVYGREHVKAGFTSYFEGIPLLPVQLIESTFVFLVVFTGCFLLLNHYTAGSMLVLYTIVYGAFRFAIEFVRGDPERPYWKGLSEAQWTTLLLLFVSLVLGFSGKIPLYTWHIIIIAIVFATALLVLIRNDDDADIFNSRHIKQIALRLKETEGKQSVTGNDISDSPVVIHQTKKGLYLSKGRTKNAESETINYTVSSRKKHVLNYNMVHKLAVLIQLLQKHNSAFQIIEKQNGIFHIIFLRIKTNKEVFGDEISAAKLPDSH